MKSTIDLTEYRDKPLRWWQERGEPLYPTLAQLAYDVFAIPGMSLECERAFSQSKKMVTDERDNLKAVHTQPTHPKLYVFLVTT